MENNKFYLKGLDNSKEISLDFIRSLADFAVTLEPDVGTNEITSYVSALNSYFANNKEDVRSESYYELVTSTNGMDIVHTCVALSLVEAYLKERPKNKLLLEEQARLMASIENQVGISQEITESRK